MTNTDKNSAICIITEFLANLGVIATAPAVEELIARLDDEVGLGGQ